MSSTVPLTSSTSVRHVFGPLTTTFTPPSSCFTPVDFCTEGQVASPGCNFGFMAQICTAELSGGGTAGPCWPSLTNSAMNELPNWYGWGLYSPGLICPSGHTSACSATAGGSSEQYVGSNMAAGETAVGCCPSGLICTSFLGDGVPLCQSVADEGAGGITGFPVMMCSNTYESSSVFLYAVETSDGVQMTIRAPMHELRWRSSDREAPHTKDGSTQNSKDGSSSRAKHHEAAHLSKGSIAAIGTCVSLAVLALLVIAALMFRKRMQSSRRSAQGGFLASRGSTLPEVYRDTEPTRRPEKMELLQSPQPLRESLATPIEAAPRYEAEDTSAAVRTSG